MSEFSIREVIKDWDRVSKVKFCIFCYEKTRCMKDEKSIEAIELVKKWINGEGNVKELRKVSNDISLNNAIYGIAMATCTSENVEYFCDIAIDYVAYILDVSPESLYLEYMRSTL